MRRLQKTPRVYSMQMAVAVGVADAMAKLDVTGIYATDVDAFVRKIEVDEFVRKTAKGNFPQFEVRAVTPLKDREALWHGTAFADPTMFDIVIVTICGRISPTVRVIPAVDHWVFEFPRDWPIGWVEPGDKYCCPITVIEDCVQCTQSAIVAKELGEVGKAFISTARAPRMCTFDMYDGRGYPMRVQEPISFIAHRILAVAKDEKKSKYWMFV